MLYYIVIIRLNYKYFHYPASFDRASISRLILHNFILNTKKFIMMLHNKANNLLRNVDFSKKKIINILKKSSE